MDSGRALLENPSKLSRAMVVWHKKDEIINFTHASLHSVLKSRNSLFVGLELTASRAASPHNMTIVNDPQWQTFVDMAGQFLSENDHVVDSKSVGSGDGVRRTSSNTRKVKRRVL